MNKQLELELFPPPELPPLPGSLEMEFDLVLKDGCKVRAYFDRASYTYISHIDFYGDVSDTGYRSVFVELLHDADDVVKQKIEEIAEYWRADMLDNIAKEAKKKRRRKKVK
jgi:thiamine pyrophosphate-dependent acetolactate synthase large subunit-like protein